MSLAYRVGIFQTVKTLGNGTQGIIVQPDKILRYDLTNATCINSNNYKSGNLVAYRENLIKKIGIEEVERLETEKPVKKWTAEELQDIINTYKAKLCKQPKN